MSCIKLIILQCTKYFYAPTNINKIEIICLFICVCMCFFSLDFSINKLQIIRCAWKNFFYYYHWYEINQFVVWNVHIIALWLWVFHWMYYFAKNHTSVQTHVCVCERWTNSRKERERKSRLHCCIWCFLLTQKLNLKMYDA